MVDVTWHFKIKLLSKRKKQYIFVTESNLLMLFVKVIAVYPENYTKYLNTLREKLRELDIVTPCGKFGQRCSVKD